MNNFLKGMATGLVIGATASIAVTPLTRPKKTTFKSTAGQAMKNVSNVISGLSQMMSDDN